MGVGNGDLLKELRIDRSQREDSAHGVSRRAWVTVALLALILASAAAMRWSGSRAVQVKTVVASAPAAGESGAVLQATGYVTARRQATVSAQIVGTLTEVLIEEGDHVEQGQVLARLDDSAQRAYLNSTKANADASAAQAGQLHAQLKQAERDRDRQNDLANSKLVATQQAEQARTQAEILRAQLLAAQAQAKSAVAQIAVAQVNYDYTEIRAPFAGVIIQKAAQVGEIVSPSAGSGGYTRTGIGTIVDMDSLEVDVDVNQAYIGRVKAGMPAEAVLDAYPNWKISARVIAIVPAADRGKATVKVRVGLDEKDPRIVPDMGVRVSFLEKAIDTRAADAPKGVLVPASAILMRDGKRVLFIVEGKHARLHAVAPAAQTYGELRLVPEGIAAGAEVIDQPPESLVDGASVVGSRR